jgi:Protein kinase domain
MKWAHKLLRTGRAKRGDGPDAAPAPDLPGYSNINRVAIGDFAAVYRAVELGTSRPVALKILHTAGSPARAVGLFNEQLPDLLLLSKHPNVVTLYRSFRAPGGQPVLAMELCRESFAQRLLESGPLPPTDVVPVAIKISGALESAHGAGLVHGDMKPENVLVSQFGEPELADLGLAGLRTVAESTERLAGATTLHTAPEVLEGAAPSALADVYGLASAMYQLIVGRGPFVTYEGERSASVILRVLRDPAPRPSLSSMPIVLADLLEAALAKDPLARPQSALAFAEALQAVEAVAGWPRTRYVAWGPAELGALRTGVTLLQPGRAGDQLAGTDRDDAPEPAGDMGGGTGGDTGGYSFERAEGADGGGDETDADKQAARGVLADDAGTEQPPPAEQVHDPYAFWDYPAISPEFAPRSSGEPSVPGIRRVVAPPPVERTVIVPQPVAPRQQPVVLPDPLPGPRADSEGHRSVPASSSENDQEQAGEGT